MAHDVSAALTDDQREKLRRHGEEREAAVGDVLYRVGDRGYPFIAIVDGEAAILDADGNEIARHRRNGFLGELSLFTGQTVLVTAVVTEPMRYIAVEREQLRRLLFDDPQLSEVVTSAYVRRRDALQERELGLEIVGPRSSAATRAVVEYIRRNRLPHVWRDTDDAEFAALARGLRPEQLPTVTLPGGTRMEAPRTADLSRALGIGLRLAPREEVDLLVVGAGPGGLGAAVYGASEGLDTLVVESTAVGGQAGMSRRIENYLGFPGGISGFELTSRAVDQARKFGARFAAPYRAVALEPDGTGRAHIVRLDDGCEIAARALVLATGAAYRRLHLPNLTDYEGTSVFYAAGPPEARHCAGHRVGVVGGGNSAGQAAIWLTRAGALVTLLHRRKDLRETMSDYLIRDLDRHHVDVRHHSEIAELHGEEGRLSGVTLIDGTQLPVKFLFMLLGAVPATDWLAETVARDADGFILTGAEAGIPRLLETSVPGIFAAGDARSGSIKRCATAVGEGAMVVRFAYERRRALEEGRASVTEPVPEAGLARASARD